MTAEGTEQPAELTEADAAAFRAQLGLDDAETVEAELLPAPDADRAFGLGYAVGRSSVQAEAAAVRVFRAARRRGYLLDAIAVGAGWFIGSWLADR